MSRYHENICWQSKDGTWSCGFYRVASYPEDPDDEYGVEFSDDFQWVSSGHATADDALRAWRGANPGYTSSLRYTKDCAGEIADLELKAAELEERESRAEQSAKYGWSGTFGYEGPSRLDDREVLRALAGKYARAVAETRCSQIGYRLQGYGNDLSGQLADQTERRDKWTRRSRMAGARKIDDGSQSLLDGLRDLKRRDDERRAERSRYGAFGGFGYRPEPAGVADARRELRNELDKAERAATERTQPKLRKSGAKPPGTGISRVPAGNGSRGGQFAPTRHAEPNATLDGRN